MKYLDASPQALAHIIDAIEAGAAISILPLGVQSLAGGQAAVLLTIGGVRHGLSAGDARLVARVLQDDDARHDAGPIAVALKAAAMTGEQAVDMETSRRLLAKPKETSWSGAHWPTGHEFPPCLPRRAA